MSSILSTCFFLPKYPGEKITVWDLMGGVKKKFGFKLDPVMVAADFTKVEEFDFLPKMAKPLTVTELHEFLENRQGSFRRDSPPNFPT